MSKKGIFWIGCHLIAWGLIFIVGDSWVRELCYWAAGATFVLMWEAND